MKQFGGRDITDEIERRKNKEYEQYNSDRGEVLSKDRTEIYMNARKTQPLNENRPHREQNARYNVSMYPDRQIRILME